MRASSIDIEKSISVITEYLVKQICIKYKCSEDKALCDLIKTSTYALLQSKSSKLYAESPEYVFNLLTDELNDGIDTCLKF